MDDNIKRAKGLLREQLRNHPDDGVRTLAEMTEFPDDHPAVQRIAKRLSEKKRVGL